MFRRSTKATALLIAAASVLSIVPASAATKLGTKDGTVENAVAFADGKYLYQGYRTDDDDNGLYYNSGDKDKMLDDADEIIQKFDGKYLAVEDSGDQYVVDMSTGKISDEDTLEDMLSTVTTKLENKLSKTERYEDIDFDGTTNTIERITGNTFQDDYYLFNVPATGTETNDKFGYTTASGKYIDCSYDLNMYVYYNPTTGSGSNGKTYKIEDVEDKVDVKKGDRNKLTLSDNGDVELAVSNLSFVKYLGQDEKYIYSLVSAKVSNAVEIDTNDVENNVKYFVQKVSKEQGDKQDDAYLPKSTEMFEVSERVGNSDAKDAYEMLITKFALEGEDRIETVVADGNIYVVYGDDDTVNVYKLALKSSEKVDRYDVDGKKDGKVGIRVAIKTDDTDEDMTDWSIDTKGTVWAIYKGKIMKSTKAGDFETVYTCDRSLDKLDVYDENNLIAWENDGDVYTTVGEGSEAAKEEAEDILGEDTTTEDTTTTVKTGWDQLADGTWNLYDATGKKVTGWANVGGVWYYMDPTTAVMRTGWVLDNGTWYYCNASGAMQTGWLNDNGTWYYLQSNGAMKTGWLEDTDGRWYFLQANGAMAANTTIDGYKLGANGAWIR